MSPIRHYLYVLKFLYSDARTKAVSCLVKALHLSRRLMVLKGTHQFVMIAACSAFARLVTVHT
jgi:hypothetical protein